MNGEIKVPGGDVGCVAAWKDMHGLARITRTRMPALFRVQPVLKPGPRKILKDSEGEKERNMEQKPSVGRVVHYTNLEDKDGRYPPEQQAAIITGVYPAHPEGADGTIGPMHVDLHIFYRTGQFDMKAVPYSESYERGHWSWPPRV